MKSNKITVNRQKLFLDFIKGELEIKIKGVYTDDYYGDAQSDYQKTEYMVPSDKLDYFHEITRGYIHTQDNINYSGSFASFKYFDLKRLAPAAAAPMDKKDIYLLEIIQDIKKNKELDSHNMSNTVNSFTLYALINHFNNDENLIDRIILRCRYTDDTEKMINGLPEQFKNIDLNKYLEMFKTFSYSDLKTLQVYCRYEFDGIKSYIEDLEEIAAAAPAAAQEIEPGAIETEIPAAAQDINPVVIPFYKSSIDRKLALKREIFKEYSDNEIETFKDVVKWIDCDETETPAVIAPEPEVKKTIPFYASQLDIFGEEQRVKCNYSQMSLF